MNTQSKQSICLVSIKLKKDVVEVPGYLDERRRDDGGSCVSWIEKLVRRGRAGDCLALISSVSLRFLLPSSQNFKAPSLSVSVFFSNLKDVKVVTMEALGLLW